MFIRYNFLLVCILAGSNQCWGMVKVARISLGLAYELCQQYSEFNASKVVPHSPRKSALGPSKELTAEVRWTRCDPHGKCSPFKLYVYSAPPGGYDRIVRHPVVEYTYPALVAYERAPWIINRYLFQGHGVLLDNLTMLTSASSLSGGNGKPQQIHDNSRFKMGGSDRKKTKTEAKWCYHEPHPKWDWDDNSYNFGIIRFKEPVFLTEKIKPMKFAQRGQEIKGPCRYASWTKYNVEKVFHSYTSDLMEASVTILPDDVCQKAGFPKTHICTPPLFCGRQDSGAPLICSDNNVDYIYALSSHYIQDYNVPKPCGGKSLSSFTKITEMDWDWIDKIKKRGSLICAY